MIFKYITILLLMPCLVSLGFIPALFVAADGDNFVSMNHSKLIHDKYGGDKNIIIVDGDHNSPRPRFLYDSVAIFLTTTLQIPEDWVLEEGHNYIRRMPWTYRASGHRGQKSGHGLPRPPSSTSSSAHHSRNNSGNSFYPPIGIGNPITSYHPLLGELEAILIFPPRVCRGSRARDVHGRDGGL